jgi:hypothetical protein
MGAGGPPLQIALLISTAGVRPTRPADDQRPPPAPEPGGQALTYVVSPEGEPYAVQSEVPVEVNGVGAARRRDRPVTARAAASEPGARVEMAVLQEPAAPNDQIDLDLAMLHGERRAALGGYGHLHSAPCPFCAAAVARYGNA